MFLGNLSTDISLRIYIYKYTAAQTFGIRKISQVFKRVSSAHYGCIYSIKNTGKMQYCEILLLFKISVFYVNMC